MKSFKYLMSVILSLVIILSGTNSCFGAWWLPREGDIEAFITDITDEEKFSLQMSAEEIEDFFMKEINSENTKVFEFIDFILDENSKVPMNDVVDFAAKVFLIKNVTNMTVFEKIKKVAEKFREEHTEQIQVLKLSRDAKTSFWKWFIGKDKYQKETEVKKLILFVPLLIGDCKLSRDDKITVKREVNSLLGGVFDDLKSYDREGKRQDGKLIAVKEELRGEIKEVKEDVEVLKKRVDALEEEIRKFRTTMNSVFADVSSSTHEMVQKLSSRSLRITKEDLKKFEDAFLHLTVAVADQKGWFEREEVIASRIGVLESRARKFGERLHSIESSEDDRNDEQDELRRMMSQLESEISAERTKWDTALKTCATRLAKETEKGAAAKVRADMRKTLLGDLCLPKESECVRQDKQVKDEVSDGTTTPSKSANTSKDLSKKQEPDKEAD